MSGRFCTPSDQNNPPIASPNGLWTTKVSRGGISGSFTDETQPTAHLDGTGQIPARCYRPRPAKAERLDAAEDPDFGELRCLLRQAQGVYRVAAAPHSFEAALWVAALWVAALSTGSVFVATTAAYLWGMVAEHTGLIRVAVPRAVKVVAPPEVLVIRSDRSVARRSTRHGLPVASRIVAAIGHLRGQSRTEASDGAALHLGGPNRAP
jgi:hypothetical protein